VRLWRELSALGYSGGYTVVKEAVHELRPAMPQGFEHRFETPAGEQGQVDFGHFRVHVNELSKVDHPEQ
jgi:transposase